MKFRKGPIKEVTWKFTLAVAGIVVIWQKADDVLTVQNIQTLLGLFS